jgi:hypothetical protein
MLDLCDGKFLSQVALSHGKFLSQVALSHVNPPWPGQAKGHAPSVAVDSKQQESFSPAILTDMYSQTSKQCR